MKYLYHVFPNKMTGEKLLPYNELLKLNIVPDKEKINILNNVPLILDTFIEELDCKISDVIHLTPINPIEIAEEYSKRVNLKLTNISFFKIQVESLDITKLALYKTINPFISNEFLSFDKFTEENCHFTKEDRDTYNELRNNDESIGAMIYLNTYQVLYKGEISTKNLEIVKL